MHSRQFFLISSSPTDHLMTAQECFFIFLNDHVTIFFAFKDYFNFFKVALLQAKIFINKPIPEITHGATCEFLSSWTTLPIFIFRTL